MLKTTLRQRKGVSIADLSGRITMGSGDRVLHDLVDELLGSGQRKILLNLGEVRHIDSSGLGELVAALRVTKAMAGHLKILSPPGRVIDTLSVARLLPLFEVFKGEDDALQSFGVAETAEPVVQYEAADGVALITLRRPRRFNALTRALTGELLSVLSAARRDREVRAVVLTGAGKAFCFGADVDELGDAEGVLSTLEQFQSVIRELASMPKPVLAAVNGFATGAGLDLALACDLRVMSQTAKLSSAFVKFGLVPDGGSTRALPRLIGPGRAAEMVMTGRPVSAEEALAWGLVNRITRSTEVVAEARAWAVELAEGPVRAIGRAKRLLRSNPERELAAALASEARAQTESFADDEFLEGLAAHREKREPSFLG